MLEGDEAEAGAGEQINRARDMLVERGDAERINGTVKGELGLSAKNREYPGAYLKNKVSEDICVPSGVTRADKLGREISLENPRGHTQQDNDRGQ